MVAALGAQAVFAALFSWLWDLRRRPPDASARTPRGRALRLYDQLRRSLARAGLAAPPSATPDEFAAEYAAVLLAQPALGASVARATALHERAAYSQHPVAGSETTDAERLWAESRWARLVLVVRRVLGRRSR